MNGKRFFLDTNAIVQLLSGNPSILETISEAEYIATSVICEVEFFSFSGLTEEDRNLFIEFAGKIEIIDLCSSDTKLKSEIYDLRSKKQLKLPDAIIAASSGMNECILLTADRKLLKLPDIIALGYELM